MLTLPELCLHLDLANQRTVHSAKPDMVKDMGMQYTTFKDVKAICTCGMESRTIGQSAIAGYDCPYPLHLFRRRHGICKSHRKLLRPRLDSSKSMSCCGP